MLLLDALKLLKMITNNCKGEIMEKDKETMYYCPACGLNNVLKGSGKCPVCMETTGLQIDLVEIMEDVIEADKQTDLMQLIENFDFWLKDREDCVITKREYHALRDAAIKASHNKPSTQCSEELHRTQIGRAHV